MIKYGFFDAVTADNGQPDRIYSSDDVNSFFDGVLSEGVFERYGNAFRVTQNTDANMQIIIESGRQNTHCLLPAYQMQTGSPSPCQMPWPDPCLMPPQG